MQSVVQQVPSTQKPDAHCVPAVQLCPLFSLQLPAPSQALLPVQGLAEFESCWSTPMFVVHCPFTFAQDLQVCVQASIQHVPSTQLPLAHCPPFMQPVAPSLGLQLPAPSHALPLVHGEVALLSG